MEYRGARMQGPPPHTPFRQRGRGSNHHPVPNQHHQVQPRLFNPTMNQAPWNTQSHNAQPDSISYPQPAYTPETGYSGYSYPPQDILTQTPQPQSFTGYAAPQMYMQPPVMFDPTTCFPQPPMVTTPPVVTVPEPLPLRTRGSGFQFNSKDNVIHCVGCGHKNSLAETEIIKRDERIDTLEKENQMLRQHLENEMAENASLRCKLRSFQPQSQDKELKDIAEMQKKINIEVAESSVKNVVSENKLGDSKKPSLLSPDAAEFSPKPPETLSTPEVPVVSAKVMTDDEGDGSSAVRGSEVATQVEENLFEETSQVEMTDISESAVSSAEFSKDSTAQVQHANWSDEVDKTQAQEEPPQEPKAVSEATPVANDEWDESAMSNANTAQEQNWRESSSQSPRNDHWQQRPSRRNFNRGAKFSNKNLAGYGRGKKNLNDQEQFSENNFRTNYSQSHNKPDNKGYGNQGNQQPNRYQRSSEENYDRPREQRDGHQRYDGKNQRVNDKRDQHEAYQKQNDNFVSEQNNESVGKTITKHEEKSNYTRDKDSSRNSLSKEKSNQDNSETIERESGSPVQSVWRGKNNNLNFNKEEKKESSLNRISSNQTQGNKNFGHYPSKPQIPDIIKEVTESLFNAPDDFSLAHCVAEDFRMSSGIAVKFKEEFKRVGELLDQNVRVGGCAHLEDKGRYIFYLVTKELSIGKPKLEDLQESLRAMKAKCVKFGVKKLAMPRIGCGLDKLNWPRVKSSINETFHDMDIEIRVYDWNVERASEADGNKPEPSSMLPIKFNYKKLVEIAPETALIFFGTEDGYMDPTAISLNEKHHFEEEYKRAEKKVGSVVCLNKNDRNYDWVFSLIVAKRKGDRILFANIEQCCSQLSQLIRRFQFLYAGLECPQAWSDDKVFFEKVLSVFRTSLFKTIELHVCYPDHEMDITKPIRDKMKESRDRDNRERGHSNYK